MRIIELSLVWLGLAMLLLWYRVVRMPCYTYGHYQGELALVSPLVGVHSQSGVHRILSSRRDPNLPPAPYATLSDHTLPITDVSIGMGIFPRIRLMSASSDGSCKVTFPASSTLSVLTGLQLWDLTIPTLPLLTTFNFPAPAQVTHLSLDPSERFFFACYCKPVDSLAEKGQASTVSLRARGEHHFLL